MSERKVIIVGSAASLASTRLREVLDKLDELDIGYELQEECTLVLSSDDPINKALMAIDHEPPPIISPLEGDSKPYPERNRKKGKGKRW